MERWAILTVDFVDFYWMAILLGKKSPKKQHGTVEDDVHFTTVG